MNWLGYVAVGVLVLLAGGFFAVTELPKPSVNGTIRVEGLVDDVEIVRDGRGVAHIYASNDTDLFFAQGFATAQDRLFQMELSRRAGQGTLSELFGELALDADKAIRTLGLNRAAEAFVEAMSPETRRLADAYVSGINAWIARNHKPLEFLLLGIEPEPWQVSDTMAVSAAMAMTLQDYFDTITRRARAQAILPPEYFAEINAPYDTSGSFGVNAGWDGEVVASNSTHSEFAIMPLAESTLASLEKFSSELASVHTFMPLGEGLGSNAWVVDGTLTDTGKPYLANDPHLPNRQPATWYEVHLNAPGWNVIGASLPGVPGVIIGHNNSIGWGITNGYLAVQDLFVEQVNPENPHEFLFQDQWESADIVTELIHVQGFDEPVVHEVVITRHGPIINSVVEFAEPVALGWTFTEPTDLLGGLLMMNQAVGWDFFRQGLAAVPFDLNFVYADVEGNIGYQMTGFLPKRPKGYTGLPVPGWTGEWGWEGLFSQDEIPHTLNPSTHFIANGNNRPFGPELDHIIAGEWSAPFRAARITEMLQAKSTFTLDDMRDIQADAYVEPYVRLLDLLEAHQLTAGLVMLTHWDGVVREGDATPVLLDTVMREAVRLAFQQRLGDTPNFVSYLRGVYWLLDIAESNPNSWWFDDPNTAEVEMLEHLLTAALGNAIQILSDGAGDMKNWTWAKQRPVSFSHPLGGLPVVGAFFNRSTPTAGGRLTVNRDNTSYRIIVDLDDLSRSVSSLTTGQSGHPFSSHYADQLKNWRMVQHQSMLWTRSDVDVHKQAILTLRPL